MLGKTLLQQLAWSNCCTRFGGVVVAGLRSTSASASAQPVVHAPATAEDDQQRKGWLQRMWGSGGIDPTIDPTKQSHSTMLADKDTVYELQVHQVKPEAMEEYLSEYAKFTAKVHEKNTGAELAGSWTVEIGDQDEAVHLWRYRGGYTALNAATLSYRTDPEFTEFRQSRNKMLRSRRNQIMLAFSFWGDVPLSREGDNIYELRTYTLKPGTMIEWGNNWAQGIRHRQSSRGVGGFFSQIGDLYTVNHIWSYDDLQSRKEIRESAWKQPGWDDIVRYTVPLMQKMTSRIMIPTPFSPLK